MAGKSRLRTPAAVVVAAALVLFALAIAFDEPVAVEPAPADAAATERADPPLPPRAPEPVTPPSARSADAVDRVIDGDTIVLRSGTIVRLVQIDAPETRGAECYADEATAALTELLPAGAHVRVEADPGLDQVDRYGRRLAYVFRDGHGNVNATLVRDGAASVWFYRGARGRYADELLAAAEEARAAGRGLWGACEATLDPLAAVATSPRSPSAAAAPPAAATEGGDACHPAYDPCLPIVSDLNCPAVRALGKAPVRVRGADPYRLDGDGNGVGCQ